MKDRTTYTIRAEIRDENHKLIVNSKGNPVTHIKLQDVTIMDDGQEDVRDFKLVLTTLYK